MKEVTAGGDDAPGCPQCPRAMSGVVASTHHGPRQPPIGRIPED
jgi:hypothetical protein